MRVTFADQSPKQSVGVDEDGVGTERYTLQDISASADATLKEDLASGMKLAHALSDVVEDRNR